MRIYKIVAFLLAGAPMIAPALAEPVTARCKIERVIDLGDASSKATLRSEIQRADAYDWVFVYDAATSNLCQVASELCVMTSENVTETDGIKATLTREGPDARGVLLLKPDGSWIYQEGLIQTKGGSGDCTFSPPSDLHVALLTSNPELDRDVLCAARLAVEANILLAQGQSQHVQSILAWAQSLLDRTNNRGYSREARSAAIQTERASYAARDDAARAGDIKVCQARVAELSQ